jgi:hypothetical protein
MRLHYTSPTEKLEPEAFGAAVFCGLAAGANRCLAHKALACNEYTQVSVTVVGDPVPNIIVLEQIRGSRQVAQKNTHGCRIPFAFALGRSIRSRLFLRW